MTSRASMYTEVQKSQRDQRVLEHLSLVKRIAYHLSHRLPASVKLDDLVQAGMVGLIEAAKQYDPSQGASFETYAGIRIRGAILDEVRHADWSPRSLHRKMRQVSDAMRDIENTTGREARDVEIAEHMGISLDDYHQIVRDNASARLFSLDDYDENTGTGVSAHEPEPLAVLQQEGFQQSLAQCIAGLPEREKMVMSLYYNDELNLKEIGKVLDISESRVCQIHGQALGRIRARMVDWLDR